MAERGRGRQRGLELGVILLVHEIFRLGYNNIPPVTLTTVIAQALLYIGVIDVGWDKYDVCISGYKVWNNKDYMSLFLSSFEHATDTHLYYNMISYLVKGRTLENKHGSVNFALLLVFLCIATPVMYVCLAVATSHLLHDKDIMRSCAIGFSGVIFALKLITTIEENGESYIAGLRVPVKYSAWVELIAIHVLVPNASFMGHLAGVLVGFIYMKTYVGTLVDHIITSISGKRMRHRPSRYGSNRESSSWFSGNSQSGWSDSSYQRHSYTSHSSYQRVPGYENDYEDTYQPPPQPGWRF